MARAPWTPSYPGTKGPDLGTKSTAKDIEEYRNWDSAQQVRLRASSEVLYTYFSYLLTGSIFREAGRDNLCGLCRSHSGLVPGLSGLCQKPLALLSTSRGRGGGGDPPRAA